MRDILPDGSTSDQLRGHASEPLIQTPVGNVSVRPDHQTGQLHITLADPLVVAALAPGDLWLLADVVQDAVEATIGSVVLARHRGDAA